MKPLKIFCWIRRVVLVAVFVVAVFFGIAFLPGSVEGNYNDAGCLCDSVNFRAYVDGKVICYSSNHPPGSHMARYEKAPDGATNVYLIGWKPGQADRLVYQAYPRKLVTKFVSAEDGSVSWLWKRPTWGRIRDTVVNHEIRKVDLKEDGTLVMNYLDSKHDHLRTETKQPRKKDAEQAEEADAE